MLKINRLTQLNSKTKRIALAIALPFFGIVTASAIGVSTQEVVLPPMHKVIDHLALPDLPLPVLDAENTYWQEELIQSGDTLRGLLSRLGASKEEVQSFIRNSDLSSDLLTLSEGKSVSVQFGGTGELLAIQLLLDDDNGEKTLVAIEKENGEWRTSSDAINAQPVPTVRSITITRSASRDLLASGVPSDISAALNEVFGDQFALVSLRRGDRINLVYETLYHRGLAVAYGNILAVEITKNNQLYSAYHFDHGDNTGAYYSKNGQTLRKGFAVLPVDKARVSSPFGIRNHPILKTVKKHNGIDYAAPTGTEIKATATGKVTFKGVQGGYGNTIVITHPGGVETLYAHMNGFGKVALGQTIQAGTVIGFVGTTGRSTGPHLHYEARINGQSVDPSGIALPTRNLSKRELAQFRTDIEQVEPQLAAVRHLSVRMFAKAD
ncbi:MAG: M23 family metallopeptidase [Neisseriaceae bacterium]|nr:M23 family metallopeptidase [Neisseriaceae bacterium]